MVVRRTKAEWAKIVEEYKKSGQTQAAFCKEHELNPKTLGAHVRAGQSKRSTKDWAALIKSQKTSGLTRAAWCKEHGISPDTMATAERRLNAKAQTIEDPEWVELSAKDPSEAAQMEKEPADWSIRIRGARLEIEVNAAYPAEKLAALIERLVK